MKFMTYNIHEGAKASLPLVTEIIKRERPDYLAITEANTFARGHFKILQAVAHEIGLLNYDIALAGEGTITSQFFRPIHSKKYTG